MNNFEFNKSPYMFWGNTELIKTLKLKQIYEELIKECRENEIILCDSDSLFHDFLNAIRNATVNQWREELLNKKYILLENFDYFEGKNASLEELTYIFKRTKAIIILTLKKPIRECNFVEEMFQVLSSGTEISLNNGHVNIMSRAEMEERINLGDITGKYIISFYTPRNEKKCEETRVDFKGMCDKVFYVGIPDIDIEILGDYGYTYDTYFAEADELAKFIYEARAEGRDIICQCDFGQSRSAACAAAILQHFEGRGIDIFSDYRYYPNQLVYHKVFDALEKLKGENQE